MKRDCSLFAIISLIFPQFPRKLRAIRFTAKYSRWCRCTNARVTARSITHFRRACREMKCTQRETSFRRVARSSTRRFSTVAFGNHGNALLNVILVKLALPLVTRPFAMIKESSGRSKIKLSRAILQIKLNDGNGINF